MEWKEFKASEIEYPEKIADNLIAGFDKATKGLVQLYIAPIKDRLRLSSKLNNDFQFSIYISSKYVEGYRMKLLYFGYDIELLPINIVLEDSIYEEVFKVENILDTYETVNNNEEFEQLLKRVFNTNKFKNLVAGLMKIAIRNQKEGLKW